MPPTNTSTTAVSAPEAKQEQYRLLTRVVNYPIVNSVWTSATQYYTSAKEKSPLVKYGCELVETNIERGVKIVEPVITNEHVKKYSEPLLSTVDSIGCRQLDKIENASAKIADSYASSKQLIENKVTSVTNDIRATASSLVEISQTKLVPPVDDYLKNSVLAYPINTVLNVTERVCDTILPAKAVEEDVRSADVGPVVRAGRLTQKYQRRALSQLNNLSLRTPAQISAMKFTVNLIQYAATQIDNSARAAQKIAGESVHHGVEIATTLPKTLIDTSRQRFTKVQQETVALTHEAITALHSAIALLSQTVHNPSTVITTSVAVYETLRERTFNAARRLSDTLTHAAQVSFASADIATAETLRRTGQLIQAAVDRAVQLNLPPQVLTLIGNVLDILNAVLPKHLALTTSKTVKLE